MFYLSCVSDKIWNLHEFVEFLCKNQGNDIVIRLFPEAVCLQTLGVYQILENFTFSSVTIETYNPFETHKVYKINYLKNFWFEQKQTVDPLLHDWNQNKKFFCFYHRPTAGRLGLASYLDQNFKKDTLIHFSANKEIDNLNQFELDKLLSYDVVSIANAGKFVQSLPRLLSSPDRYTHCNGYYYDDPLTNFYKEILVDIVVESHVSGKTFFPTEKTLRPMWLKKPFIVFGTKNFLAYLRQMGFRTFGDFWDESYDGYETKDRYKKILTLLNELSKKTRQDLETMYWDMQYSLEHNFNLLQQQNYSTKLTFID